MRTYKNNSRTKFRINGSMKEEVVFSKDDVIEIMNKKYSPFKIVELFCEKIDFDQVFGEKAYVLYTPNRIIGFCNKYLFPRDKNAA